MNTALRTTVLRVHRWTGLTLGLLFAYVALTGLGMVFQRQLQPLLEHDLREVSSCAARLPLDTLVDGARAFHPGSRVSQIEVLGGGSGTTIVRFADKEGVYMHPCSGTVLGQQHRWGGLFGTLEQLHRLKFIDNSDVTELITGTTSIVLALVMIGGGLLVWWPPGLKALRSAATLRPHLKGRAFLLNLHRTTGLYVALVLLMSALTSMTFTFPWARQAVFSLAGSPMPPPKPALESKPAAAPMAMETLLKRALASVPDADQVMIQLPRKPLDAVEIYAVERDAPHPNARTTIYMDPYTGDVMRFEPYATSSAGNKAYRWLASLHMGQIGGVPGQLLLFAGVLGLPVLGYTGIASYLRRRFPARAEASGLKARVNRISSETPGIKVFELVSATSTPLPAVSPGAHIDVRIDEDLVRQYSLCNGPEDRDKYLIAVKREPDSRGGSRALHERVSEGDILSIGAPRNHFALAPDAPHHLLLAGGIGITPILAMARHLQADGTSFALQYFTRSVGETAFHGFLSRPELRGKVVFHYALDPHGLRLYLQRLLQERPPGAHLYVCGPRPFMDLVEETAAASWPAEAVHAEYFSADPMAFAGPRAPFEVMLALTGGTYPVPGDKTIVEALAAHGVEIQTACEQGVCGTCITGLLDGVPDHRDAYLSEAERRACDKILPCVSRARGKLLVLDL